MPYKDKAKAAECSRKSTARWRAANREKLAADFAAWRVQNKDRIALRMAQWHSDNKEKRAAYKAEYRARNKDAISKKRAEYYRQNRAVENTNSARWRASMLRATPGWASQEAITSIYTQASQHGLEVDHVVPLRGRTVCGLHCEANLEPKSKSQNRAKGNRHWPDMWGSE